MPRPSRGEGPFRPGAGGLPPYLAGRETEQAFFRRRVAAMAEGVPPPNEVILWGPRGNGKTVLLVWLQGHIGKNREVEAVRLNPTTIETPTRLAERLLPDSWWTKRTPAEVSLAGITWRPGGERPPVPEEVLRARARTKPLVILLDEAHTLDLEVGRVLLQASQVVGREVPFLLVLAGTPDLPQHLAAMSASFWNRARRIPVNRLDAESARAAIRRPLEEEGIAIAAEALDRIVRESDGYPYFVQLWGEMVWRRAVESKRRRITLAEVEAAQPEFEWQRGIYYLDRYDELDRARLLPAARAVADAFAEAASLPDGDIERAVREGNGVARSAADTAAAMTTLRHLGFLWRPGPTPRSEPGIPSLMDYIREHAPAS